MVSPELFQQRDRESEMAWAGHVTYRDKHRLVSRTGGGRGKARGEIERGGGGGRGGGEGERGQRAGRERGRDRGI